jgi:hypothetical protein
MPGEPLDVDPVTHRASSGGPGHRLSERFADPRAGS